MKPSGTSIRPAPTVSRPMSPRMRLSRVLYAGGILCLPPIFTVVALSRAARLGIGWAELGPLVAMYFVTQLGVTLGYHRYASHRSFAPITALEWALLVAGSMAGQGPVIHWAADHRRHHHFSDRPGDPHSPRYAGERRLGAVRGLWHAHVGWTFSRDLTNTLYYCRDLMASSGMRFVSRAYGLWVLLGLVLPALLGWAIGGDGSGALSGLLWGGFVRLLLTYHATLAVNSLTHAWGTRPHASGDFSRNNAWLAVPTLGEGWHNNHHAFPGSAFFGHSRWQLDLGGLALRAFCALGWARSANRPGPHARAPRPGQPAPAVSSMRVADPERSPVNPRSSV